MTQEKIQKYINVNESLLFSVEDVFASSDKVVLSKWSAASFWGFSPKIDSEWFFTVPKGYNNNVFNKKFNVNQKVERKFKEEVIAFNDGGINFKVYSPERTLVELIKDAKYFYDDVLVETINNFFENVDHSFEKLMKIAKEYRAEGEVAMARYMHG